MRFNQRLSAEIEPGTPDWRSATAADRLAFFKRAGDLAVDLKRDELTRAIGADGRRMKARKHPRPDGANGPVMTPHDDASRTARLMASHADPRGMTLFWRSGHSRAQRLPWGTILGFHARGEVRGAPSRDVRLSKAGITKLRGLMADWWRERSAETRRKILREERAAAERPGRVRRAVDALAGKARAFFGGKPATPSGNQGGTPGPRPFGKPAGDPGGIAAKYPGYAKYLRDPRGGK